MTKEIKFIGLDGKDYTFNTETNPLNNKQMWTLNGWHTCVAGTKRHVNGIIKAIKELQMTQTPMIRGDVRR